MTAPKPIVVHPHIDEAGRLGFHREERCPARHSTEAMSGPAQVATESYRANWDGIFGKRATVGEA